MLDKNEVKKDLYKSKAIAKLMYYDPSSGDLQYIVEVLGKAYTFPIHTIQQVNIKRYLLKDDVGVDISFDTIKLTDDLKGARFDPEIRGSSLIRWIQQAIDKDEFH